jgi:hypothetical protein
MAISNVRVPALPRRYLFVKSDSNRSVADGGTHGRDSRMNAVDCGGGELNCGDDRIDAT